jgi:hypothetical protein
MNYFHPTFLSKVISQENSSSNYVRVSLSSGQDSRATNRARDLIFKTVATNWFATGGQKKETGTTLNPINPLIIIIIRTSF